jgi:hypothetical protein
MGSKNMEEPRGLPLSGIMKMASEQIFIQPGNEKIKIRAQTLHTLQIERILSPHKMLGKYSAWQGNSKYKGKKLHMRRAYLLGFAIPVTRPIGQVESTKNLSPLFQKIVPSPVKNNLSDFWQHLGWDLWKVEKIGHSPTQILMALWLGSYKICKAMCTA